VDVISFGEEKGNDTALNEFVNTLNGKDGTGSHLLAVAGSPSLTDALVQSPILQGEDGGPIPGLGAGGGYDFDGADDPELAIALRVSMEEQRARQEGESRANTTGEPGAEGASNEEQMLEQALQMSMDNPMTGGAGGAGIGLPRASGGPDFSSMTEDEQIAYALQMSMQESATTSTPASTEVKTEPVKVKKEDDAMEVDEAAGGGEIDEGLGEADPEYLQQVLEGLPTNSPNKKGVEKKPADPKSGGGSGSKKK